MKTKTCLILLIGCLCTLPAAGQESEITLPGTEVAYLSSDYVEDMTYRIEVILPPGYNSSEDTVYPVLFYLDAYMTTGVLYNAEFILSTTGMIEPVILIGINFDANTEDYLRIRARDYTPTYVSPDSLDDDAAMIPASGGGPDFLQFIRHELIPFVDSEYRINNEDLGIMGYSLGGLFAFWILQEEPGLFKRYVLGSPSLRWDNYQVLNMFEKQPPKFENKKSIVLTRTEFENPVFENGFKRLESLLERMENSTVSNEYISGENHFSGVPATYTRALRTMYGIDSND